MDEVNQPISALLETIWSRRQYDDLIAEQAKSLKLCQEVVKLRKELRESKQVREQFDRESG